jgi:hypothetical protein
MGGEVLHESGHQAVIAGGGGNDLAQAEGERLFRDALMRDEGGRLLQPRPAETPDHLVKIAQAFAAGQGHGIELPDFPQLEQGRRDPAAAARDGNRSHIRSRRRGP